MSLRGGDLCPSGEVTCSYSVPFLSSHKIASIIITESSFNVKLWVWKAGSLFNDNHVWRKHHKKLMEKRIIHIYTLFIA